MITRYTIKELQEAIENEDFIIEYTTHIADKLRAIYTLFGWVHMLKEFETAQETIDNLMNHIYKELIKGRPEIRVSTAGLMIEGWLDEDGLVNLDYYFDLA